MLTLNPSGAFSVAPSGLGIGREGFGCGAVGSGSWGTRCCAIKTAHTETAPIQIRTNVRLIGSTPRFKFHCLHIVAEEAGSQEAGSRKPEARSQKPEARSQKPEARSQHRESPFWLLASGFWLLASGFFPYHTRKLSWLK